MDIFFKYFIVFENFSCNISKVPVPLPNIVKNNCNQSIVFCSIFQKKF